MDKLADLINHCYEQIHQKVDRILSESPNSNFIPSQDIQIFEEWCLNLSGSNNERAIKFFAGLSAFFDGGALLLKDGELGVIQHLFLDGELFPVAEETTKSIPLPEITEFQIKGRAGNDLFVEVFQKQSTDSDIRALIIGTPTQFKYLVFSKLPHPWLHDRISHLQNCLMMTFQKTTEE